MASVTGGQDGNGWPVTRVLGMTCFQRVWPLVLALLLAGMGLLGASVLGGAERGLLLVVIAALLMLSGWQQVRAECQHHPLDAERQELLQRFQQAQSVGRIGSWEYNLATGQIWGSDEGFRLYGMTPPPGNVLPVVAIEACIPERERVHQALLDLIEQGCPYDLEFTIHPANGDAPLVIHSVAKLLCDARGAPLKVCGVIQDVTDRYRVEQALADSEQRFEIFMAQLPAAVFIKDVASGTTLFANRYLEELLGWHDWAGKTTEELLPAEVAAAMVADDQQTLREGPRHFRERVTDIHGQDYVFETFKFPIQINSQNRLLGGISLDITERVRTEEALRESEQWLRHMVENLPAGAVYMKGNQLFLNHAAEVITGYSRDELTTLDLWFEALYGAASVQVREYYENDRRQRFPATRVVPLRRKDGVERLVEFLGYASEQGEIWLLSDVTERQQAEMASRRSAERLRLVNEIDRAILSAQAPAHVAGSTLRALRQLIPCQRASVLSFDYEHAEIRVLAVDVEGETALDTQTRFPLATWNLDALAAGEVVVITDLRTAVNPPPPWQMLSAEGIVAVAILPLRAHGELIGTLNLGANQLGYFDCNSEQLEVATEVANQMAVAIEQGRLYEQARRHTEELEKHVAARTAQLQVANQELEAFSYSVSHDLRAPLRAIDGFSRIVLEDFAEQLPLKGQHYLGLVRSATQRMGQLIDDLLAFSRLGRKPLHRQWLQPDGLVRQVLDDLHAEQAGRRIDLVIGALPPCQADPGLLQQVFANLLGNALKFTRGRDPARIEVGGGEQEGKPLYFVRDNGVGFDMRYADKLFGVFQRLHRAEDYEGTGVGLALVQRIINRHGGRIWGEAEPEHGATFYFTVGDMTKTGEG